jgi:hypothetical protein
MPRKRPVNIESERFTIILKVNNWDLRITHNKHQRDKNWPEPVISESWTSKPVVIYSDCPKYKVGDEIKIWLGTNYDYMVYHLRKDFRYADPKRPDDRFASISYDQHMQNIEDNSYKCVGSISKDQLLAGIPKEIADRLASCPQMCSYIDLYVYRNKGLRHWLIQSLSLTSSVDLSDYTG